MDRNLVNCGKEMNDFGKQTGLTQLTRPAHLNTEKKISFALEKKNKIESSPIQAN